MAELGMPLLVHGEVTDPTIDVFDRERVFIECVLRPLLARHPQLRVVFEHITTADAANFVADCGPNVAATITAHHLLYNRNAIFAGGVRPHYYCLPVLKRERHRQALLRAATSGNPKFFLGTDSAPHACTSQGEPPAVAPVVTRHMQRSNSTRQPSSRQALSIGWRPSPVFMARTSTVCRAMAAR
jgi:dihydroorotase